MKLRQIEKILATELRRPLAEFGFHEFSTLSWRREARVVGVAHLLAFAPREKGLDVFSCGCGVGIRFEKIETVMGTDLDQHKATLGMPIHLLSRDRSYFEWEFAANDIALVVPEMLETIAQDAIPFLEQFSDMHAVRKKLESDNPRDHFVLSAEGRASLLAAILACQEGFEAALAFLEAELQKRGSSHPKYRTQLALLKRRIESLGRTSA